ncbi:hypothetical protein BDV25DRAFT_167541 [Aspergillus avenaceus]|uniref:Uncharacterized protein n=1 Tax=Aspergillus avenaceus TaxID=36643 RepID=A0A5N6TDE6_ASPAV|nr:hypothetical protein BDV25DRAFT_167541 [Aspergillus avenaceus]
MRHLCPRRLCEVSLYCIVCWCLPLAGMGVNFCVTEWRRKVLILRLSSYPLSYSSLYPLYRCYTYLHARSWSNTTMNHLLITVVSFTGGYFIQAFWDRGRQFPSPSLLRA